MINLDNKIIDYNCTVILCECNQCVQHCVISSIFKCVFFVFGMRSMNPILNVASWHINRHNNTASGRLHQCCPVWVRTALDNPDSLKRSLHR